MDIVTAIKVELTRKNMKMFQLADLLGISRQALSKRVNGRVEFTLSEVCKVASALDMSTSELLSNAEAEKKCP